MNIQYHCKQLHKSMEYDIETSRKVSKSAFYNCKETIDFDIEQEW